MTIKSFTFRLRYALAASLLLVISSPAWAIGNLSGTVVDAADGVTPVHPVLIDLLSPLSGSVIPFHSVLNNPDGTWQINDILTGEYKVMFSAVNEAGQFVDELYDEVPCPNRNCARWSLGSEMLLGTRNMVLNEELAQGAMISGSITDATDGVTPVWPVYVSLHDKDTGAEIAYQRNLSDGSYTLGPVPVGEYKVLFNANSSTNYIDELHDEVPCNNGACDWATVGTTIVLGESGVVLDEQLLSGVLLNGTITDAADGITPVHPVMVSLHDKDNGTEIGNFTNDPDGSYMAGPVPAGSYKVMFNAVDAASDYVDKLYDDVACPDGGCNIGSLGSTITINPKLNFLDVELEKGPSLSGSVTDAIDGTTPVYPVVVSLHDKQTGNRVAASRNKADGTYSVGPVQAGEYKVVFDAVELASDYEDVLHDGIPCYNGGCDLAALGKPVALTTGSDVLDVSLRVANLPAHCLPDTILDAGFENEPPLLFEDTFEGCKSPLWQDTSDRWLVRDGALVPQPGGGVNLLPLEPGDFEVEMELSALVSGGLWMRAGPHGGVLLHVPAGESYFVWSIANSVDSIELNPSEAGLFTPGTGKHTLRVEAKGSTYRAYLDGHLVTTLTHADIVAAGRTAPLTGRIAVQGGNMRLERFRVWGENRSTLRIEFTTDQFTLLEQVGGQFQFGAQVVDSIGKVWSGVGIEWSLESSPLVSLVDASSSTATVQADALGVDTVLLEANVPSLGLSAFAQVSLADLQPGARFIPSTWVLDNGLDGSDVVLVRNATTEQIIAGDILVSGNRAGLLVRVLTVTLNADTVVLTVENVDLTEAFLNLSAEGVSAPQQVSVKYDAPSRQTKVKSIGTDGQARIQTINTSAFDCKVEGSDTPFELDISKGSLDWDIDLSVTGDYVITNGRVTDFYFSVQGDVGLNAKMGPVVFGQKLEGTATCVIELPEIKTPTFPLSIFSVQLDVEPSVGFQAKGIANAPSLSIEGPSGNYKGNMAAGFRYTPAQGWRGISVLDWNESAAQASSEQGGGLEPRGASFSLEMKAFAKADFKFRFNLGWGLDLTSITLVELVFAEFQASAGLDMKFASPFNYLDPDYTGPKWSVGAELSGKYKAELDGGAMGALLDRMNLPVTINFGGDLFTPYKLELWHSPNVANLTQTCYPNCYLAPNAGDRVRYSMTTDDPEDDGLIEYFATLNGDEPMRKLASGTMQTGASVVDWYPEEADPKGRYQVLPRLKTDPLSQMFPYAMDPKPKLAPVFLGPTHTLTLTRSGGGEGQIISDPEGIDCGYTCQTDFKANTLVKLTAKPEPGSLFVGWSGACDGSGTSCLVDMDSNQVATAEFQYDCSAAPTVSVTYSCPEATSWPFDRDEWLFRVKFTSSSPVVVDGSYYGSADAEWTKYPVRLFFENTGDSIFYVAANGYYNVKLAEGDLTDGVITFNMGVGANYSSCHQDAYYTREEEWHLSWVVGVINQCGDISESAPFDLFAFRHLFTQ